MLLSSTCGLLWVWLACCRWDKEGGGIGLLAKRVLGLRSWQCAHVMSVYLFRKLSFACAKAVTPWKPAIIRINTATQTPTKYLQQEQCSNQDLKDALRQ